MGHIEIRLDRALCNNKWLDCWPISSSAVLPCAASDHSPLVITSNKSSLSGPKPFRFQSMWFSDDNFMNIVKDCWTVPGNAFYVLTY